MKILEEQKFQMSGLTDTDKAAQLGRILNVNKIMIGTLTQLGGTYIINTRIVDVQSGQVELAVAVECRGGEEKLPDSVTELALKISYKIGLEGSIIRISGETMFIDLGSSDGLDIGQSLDVIRTGEAITDLDGRVIGTNSETIGSLTVTKIQDRFSEAAVKEGATAFRKGDKVKPSEDAELQNQKNPTRRDAPRKKKDAKPSDQAETDKIDVPPTF